VSLSASQFQQTGVPPLNPVTFPLPVTLRAGDRYAIVLSSDADLFSFYGYKFFLASGLCTGEDVREKAQSTPGYFPTGVSGSFIATVNTCDRPGEGQGDKKHVHCGPGVHK
jgi:hypothetical protein